MDTNYNSDRIESYFILDNQIIEVNNKILYYMYENIELNFLLILFTMSCLTTIICCQKPVIKNKYVVVPTREEEIENEAVKGEIIQTV